MNERPTPETMAVIDATVALPSELAFLKMTKHATKKERQLAEMRELYDLDTQTLRAERDEARDALRKVHADLGCELRDPNGTIWDHAARLQGEFAEARERLNWQNQPNCNEPVRGGYEFYINEEWGNIRDAALGDDVGCVATLRKTRIDCDDERVRVRRVLDDDAILRELRDARGRLDLLVGNSRRKDGSLPSIADLVDHRAQQYEALQNALAERDEARAERDKARYMETDEWRALRKDRDGLQMQADSLRAELDEARETLRRCHNEYIDVSHDREANMEALRDALRVAHDQRDDNKPCPECGFATMHMEDCPYFRTEREVMQ